MVLLLLAVMATVIPGTLSVTSAWRTCRPPPPCDNVCRNNSLPVCLVVGDSVSIGYTSPFLEAALNGTCTVCYMHRSQGMAALVIPAMAYRCWWYIV